MERLSGSRPSSTLLIAVGAFLLCLSPLAMVLGHAILAGGFAVLAVFVFIMSVLAPRMKGEVAAGLQGFRFELVEEIVRRAPQSGLTSEQLAVVVRRALERAAPKRLEPLTTEEGNNKPQHVDGEISEFGLVQQVADEMIEDAKRQ